MPACVTQCLLPFLQTINGEVIDLKKKAGSAYYVQGGCGAACKDNHCKLNSKCLDNYNVYECDCSLTPFYDYFCSKGMLFWCFLEVLPDIPGLDTNFCTPLFLRVQ